MTGAVGYKAWSGGAQVGLRIYAPVIRGLRREMAYPSDDGMFPNLSEWLRQLEQGRQPARYSRHAVVILPDRSLQPCTLTISTLPPLSPQGYVTAPQGSAFANLAMRNLGHDVRAEFVTSPQAEVIVLNPPLAKQVTQRQRTAARRVLRRAGIPIPRDLDARGAYFEGLEYERRKALLAPGLTIDWRRPYVDSRLPYLMLHDISCDIDIWDTRGAPRVCIEVKSVAGVPTSPFHMSRREIVSRDKCQKLGVDYEIVVYGFSTAEVDHAHAGADVRRVVLAGDRLAARADTYLCW